MIESQIINSTVVTLNREDSQKVENKENEELYCKLVSEYDN